MSPLPAPPEDPLHVLPPATLQALVALAVLFLGVLALLALGWLARRLGRARDAGSPPPATLAAAPEAAPVGSITAAIEALQRKFLRSKAFRDGCHALAAAVKSHLERVTGFEVEEMTGAEIERAFAREVTTGRGTRIGGPRLGRFMTTLQARRYGREEPRRRHFMAACEEAKELLK